jgi:mannosyltransferase
VLLAINAYHIEMSQEARAYTLWALCVTLSWDALIDALDSGRRAAWLRYVVWTALSFYAHFFTVFVIAAHCLVVAVRLRWTEWRTLVLSGVGVALLCLPFVPFFVANNDGSQILHVRRSDLDDLVDLFRMFAGSTDWLLAVLGIAGAAGAVLSLRARSPAWDRASTVRGLVPLLWLLVPVLTVFLLSYVKPMFRERYLFAAMPALVLLAAVGLVLIRPFALRLGVVAVVVGLALLPLYRGLSIRQDENWRAAVAYLETSAQPDDGWIFISKRAQLGYEYYAGWLAGGPLGAVRPDILEPFNWNELAASEAYYRALTSGTSRLPEFSARHPRIWLVLSHEFDSTFDGDTSAAVRDWLSRRGYTARQRTFQNIRVLLYERRG